MRLDGCEAPGLGHGVGDVLPRVGLLDPDALVGQVVGGGQHGGGADRHCVLVTERGEV